MTAAEALGCQVCGLSITPCLVCASPLPVPQVDDSSIRTCRSCGVVNPLGDKYREVLDIPPTLALPSAMVRRAQIAWVGRRPYVLAKHAHFMYLRSVSERKGEEEQGEAAESHGLAVKEISARLGPKGSPVPDIYASAEEGHPLKFLPYMHDTQGARVHEEAMRSGRKIVDARRFYPFSDSESPVKRMRLSPRQEVVGEDEKKLSGSVHQNEVQVPSCNGGSVAAVSNGRTSSLCTPHRHDPANLEESTRRAAGGSELIVDPPVQSSDCHSTPVKAKYAIDRRPIIGDADDGEVRSTAEGGKIPIPLDGTIEALHDVVEHRVGIANHFAASDAIEPYLQSVPSTINRLEVSKPFLDNAQHHGSGAEAPTSAAAVSNGSVDQRCKYFEHDFYSPVNIANLEKLPRTTMQKVDAEALDAHEREENDNPVGDVTGSEEVPTHRHGRVCSECGQTGGGCRLSSNVDEAEFMRCCTQILELHCPHTVKADMRTPCAYPLCCSIPRFPLPAGNVTASIKVCRSFVTQFTVDALRAAHSTLTSSTQESTSEEVASPFRGVEQTLSMAERFIEIKDRMVHVQGLIQQVDAASAQASRDFKAYSDRGAFPLASQQLPRLLSREKQQNVLRAKNDVQVMTTFLQDINKLLTTCFQYVGKTLEASLCLVDDNRADSNAMTLNALLLDLDTKPGLEAVRTAVPLWLRLYHDVAHASGLLK